MSYQWCLSRSRLDARRVHHSLLCTGTCLALRTSRATVRAKAAQQVGLTRVRGQYAGVQGSWQRLHSFRMFYGCPMPKDAKQSPGRDSPQGRSTCLTNRPSGHGARRTCCCSSVPPDPSPAGPVVHAPGAAASASAAATPRGPAALALCSWAVTDAGAPPASLALPDAGAASPPVSVPPVMGAASPPASLAPPITGVGSTAR